MVFIVMGGEGGCEDARKNANNVGEGNQEVSKVWVV